LPDSSSQKTGTLYLIPSSLGNDDPQIFIPNSVLEIIKSLDEFIVENEKTARQFLKSCSITIPQSQLIIHELDKHDAKFSQHHFLNSLLAGKNMGLMSEAGCPGVADPGAEVVNEVHKKNIRVVPLVGASSILLALMASGLNGQQFCFHGYLPKEKNERTASLKKLEKESQQKNQTQIFIETPYRNNQMFDDILSSCEGKTLLCVAADLTLQTEFVKTKTISEWKKNKIDLNKKPTVFLILKL
jgi:16S rRNA (cytidine1402-2'-O)-methyltransferase